MNHNKTGSNDHEAFINQFHQPKFTAYDFLTLFSASLANQGQESFDRDCLIRVIDACKKQNICTEILREIHLKSNGIFNYSKDLEEALARLKWAGILYTIQPEQPPTIYISHNTPTCRLINSRIHAQAEMDCFIQKYTDLTRNPGTDTPSLVLRPTK